MYCQELIYANNRFIRRKENNQNQDVASEYLKHENKTSYSVSPKVYIKEKN
jgi:hypothetical protein